MTGETRQVALAEVERMEVATAQTTGRVSSRQVRLRLYLRDGSTIQSNRTSDRAAMQRAIEALELTEWLAASWR